MQKDGENVGINCLDNNHIWKVIDQFEILVYVAVHDDSQITK